jgi:CheY-like chemotaxis protein
MARILIVEDELLIAEDIKQKLRRLGHAVVAHAATGEAAVQRTAETKPDLVLMDVRLRGEMSGIEAAQRISEFHDLAVVYVTANANGLDVGSPAPSRHFILTKPFTITELEAVIAAACNSR